jgi:hypothetical protein
MSENDGKGRERDERRGQGLNLDDWRAAEHGRYQVDRSYGEDWTITRGQVYGRGDAGEAGS